MTWEQLISTELVLPLGGKLLRIAAIALGTWLACRFGGGLVDRVLTATEAEKKLYLEEKRARTLRALLKTILRYTVYFIAVLMLLQLFQIDTTSIIAGAGIIGLALGVGAQSLVKDFITGFFIIIEDQYAVGDYIVSGDMAGTVEEMGFRVTKLRDVNGALHIIPNSAIARISNYTRGHLQAVINIPVSYQADIDQVLKLLETACRETAQLPEILEGPTVLGVVDLAPGQVMVRVIAKTVPLEQMKVETKFRHKVKILFDAAKIPGPQACCHARLDDRRDREDGSL